MANPQLCLGSLPMPGRYGAILPGGPNLQISERPSGDLLQISGWDGFENDVAPLLSRIGIAEMPGYGDAVEGLGGVTLYRLAPDRIWLRGAGTVAMNDVAAEVAGHSDLVSLDLSQARAVIAIAGKGSEDLFARLIMVDCDAAVFAPGQFRQTVLHEVSVLVHRRGLEQFEILLPSSWGAAVWTYIMDAGKPLGYEVTTG